MDDLEYYRFTDPDVGTFAIDLLRPHAWLEQGAGLLEAASVLGTELERRWIARLTPLEEQSLTTEIHQLQRVFMMLCGFAVENLCKAVMAF